MSVDVIIPVYKPDAKFDRLLAMLVAQSVKPSKILILNTEVFPEYATERVASHIKKVMKKQPASQAADVSIEVHSIKKEEFDHGGTRAYGAGLSDAEFMIFMTQDAIPKDKYLIEELLKPFKDEQVAVSYGRQLAGENAGEIESYTRVFNYPETSRKKTKKDLEQLGIKTYFCSDVCAAYRKTSYEAVGGFVTKAIFNEDMIIASRFIKAGMAVYYAADAMVYHSHTYTYWQQFTRNFDLAVSQADHKDIFEEVSSESEGMKLVKQTIVHLAKKKRYFLIIDLILQSGFKYMGYFLGKRYKTLPKSMVLKCSMNKAYFS
ncbi:MAG: glycosyltransferase family 2 protein [Lachnospiraceae bacterium]|nr:glycosyltransferase family 2 protein [Lachnospiraceae bacterium]